MHVQKMHAYDIYTHFDRLNTTDKNRAIKPVEKPKLRMPSLPQSLIVRPVCFGYPAFCSGREDREQNEAPTIQNEMVSDLLHHLDTSLWGQMGSTQRSSELAEVLTQPHSTIYQEC